MPIGAIGGLPSTAKRASNLFLFSCPNSAGETQFPFFVTANLSPSSATFDWVTYREAPSLVLLSLLLGVGSGFEKPDILFLKVKKNIVYNMKTGFWR